MKSSWVERPPVQYPESDGEPMGESDTHIDALTHYSVDVLRAWFAGQDDVYVSGNSFIYFTQGVPRDCISPDTYVVKGVPSHFRRSYRVWEEGGHTPCFVLEITSESTRRNDRGEKMARYRDELGVPEYFLFDPLGEWIEGQLVGYRLDGDLYQAIQPNAANRLDSVELGLELAVQNGYLRFFPPRADQPLLTRLERAEQAEANAERARANAEQVRANADQAEERARRAEVELARLRAELDALRGEGTAGESGE